MFNSSKTDHSNDRIRLLRYQRKPIETPSSIPSNILSSPPQMTRQHLLKLILKFRRIILDQHPNFLIHFIALLGCHDPVELFVDVGLLAVVLPDLVFYEEGRGGGSINREDPLKLILKVRSRRMQEQCPNFLVNLLNRLQILPIASQNLQEF